MKVSKRNTRSRPIMETHTIELQIRVLICKEEEEFSARALEMDLLGYGKTEAEAVSDLKSAIESQISFAIQMKDDSLLNFPSDPEYLERWEEAHRKTLHSFIMGDKSAKIAGRGAFISFTRNDLKALRSKALTFRETKPLACAETT